MNKTLTEYFISGYHWKDISDEELKELAWSPSNLTVELVMQEINRRMLGKSGFDEYSLNYKKKGGIITNG